MFKAVFVSGESRGLQKDSYFHKVASILSAYLAPMLIISPCKGKRGFIKVKKGLWYYCLPSFFHMLLFSISKVNLNSKIVIAQDPFWYGIMAKSLKSEKSKLIVEIHSQFFYNKKWFNQRFRNKIYHRVGRKNLQYADYIRVVYNDNILEKKYGKKVLYIPSNYTDTKLFKNRNLKRSIDVLFVGRLHPEKNIEYLVKILKILKQKKYRVRIVGPSLSGKYLKKIRKSYISYKKYSFNPQEEYVRSKILIILSHNEGGPRVAYEALASGCLVATTPVGKIKEDLVRHKECGIFLTGNNIHEDVRRIINLLKNYSHLWEKCYKKIRKKLNFEKQVESYAKRYSEILHKNKK